MASSSPAPGAPRRPAAWLRERLAIRALNYPVPSRANRLDFMLGGLTLVVLVLLGLTGIVLTVYYNPAPLGAHASVQYMITDLPFAGWIRDLHVWSASGAVILVFAHLVAVFWRGGFRRPREGLWWTGVLLLALLFGLAFTGTALRADQEAVEAVAHAVAGAELVGAPAALLTPEFTPSTPLLTRLYAFHVSVLPLALLALVGLHLWLIRHLGVSANKESSSSFLRHVRPLAGFGFCLIAILASMAMAFPASLSAAGVEGYEVTKPYWPFLWIYAAENLFGMNGMLVAPGVLFGFLGLVPVTDRRPGPSATVTRWAGVTLFVIMVAAIVYAAVAPGQSHLDMGM